MPVTFRHFPGETTTENEKELESRQPVTRQGYLRHTPACYAVSNQIKFKNQTDPQQIRIKTV